MRIQNEVSSIFTYEKMSREERNACALLAAEAFYDYEYFSMHVPDDKRRHRFLDAMMKTEFRANWKYTGCELVTARENDRVVAVAQLCAPGFTKPTYFDYFRSGWLSAMLSGGIKAVNDWTAMEKQALIPCKGLKGKRWYLNTLTVAKTEEGKGVGSRFLQEYIIPHVKEAGGEILCLFTNAEKNRRFYEKNGFTLFDERRFEYGEKSVGSWSYWMKL